MKAVDFNYYREKYYGDSIPQEEFKKYEKKARTNVSGLTFGKIDVMDVDEDEKVKDCICAVADIIYKNDAIPSAKYGISSESTDGHSVSYGKAKTKEELNDEILSTVQLYLADTGLLYGGVDICLTAKNW